MESNSIYERLKIESEKKDKLINELFQKRKKEGKPIKFSVSYIENVLRNKSSKKQI
tara:strand:+ start:33974 stop:34141 length:168 start_codon:yes stop_codon:yes gene_type:complete